MAALGGGWVTGSGEKVVGVVVGAVWETGGCGRGIGYNGGVLCCSEHGKFACKSVDLLNSC
jgi:hypothetical protein